MCGILFIAGLGYEEALTRTRCVLDLLNRRGPDSKSSCHYPNLGRLQVQDGTAPVVPLTFYSSVLALRGESIVPQPLEDPETGSLLCWNGEAWQIDGQRIVGNDTLEVQRGLLVAARQNADDRNSGDGLFPDSDDHVVRFLASISGPFAVIFFDVLNSSVYFGRDCLGRRSLLVKDDPDSFILSSVSDGNSDWTEVDADGIYALRPNQGAVNQGSKTGCGLFHALANFLESSKINVSHYPWSNYGKVSSFNHSSDSAVAEPLTKMSMPVINLQQLLVESLNLRVEESGARSSTLIKTIGEESTQNRGRTQTSIAVLFSGGLDCSVLARMIHDILPQGQEIDLLNVAFQNPRLQKSQNCTVQSVYELCPDRITARNAHAELCKKCPSRTWRLVEIDIPFEEAQAHRETILSLMYPHNTEMDRSIAMALYFAARGNGNAAQAPGGTMQPYQSPARVLFSGLGADELFGGYQRHATAYHRSGLPGLLDALELDITRLGKRNLGRDDRVISHWGKEARYPYLDEALVRWAVNAPVWDKCGFGQDLHVIFEPVRIAIEPGKQVLRLVALRLGLAGVACEKKRAIQFGARTAKMEGKSKGTTTIVKAHTEDG